MRQCQSQASILIHQGERQVHPGGYSRRRPDTAVPDEDRISVHDQLRVLPGKLSFAAPVTGHAPARNQAGCGEQEHAAAHRGHPACCRTGRADPFDQRRVLPGRVNPAPARDHQRVNALRITIVHTVPGMHRQGAVGPHRPSHTGNDLALVASGQAIGLLEHLEWPGQVKELEPVKDHKADPRHHHSRLRHRTPCRQRHLPHTLRHAGHTNAATPIT